MKYKVGDKVVITERKHGHQFNIGETVKIVNKTSTAKKLYNKRIY